MNKKVKVYRNIRNNLLSVVHDGLVQAHVKNIHLIDCKFVVQEGGRQRVLKEKRKNVHAYITGTAAHMAPTQVVKNYKVCKYDPYKNKNWVYEIDGKQRKITAAKDVFIFNSKDVYAC